MRAGVAGSLEFRPRLSGRRSVRLSNEDFVSASPGAFAISVQTPRGSAVLHHAPSLRTSWRFFNSLKLPEHRSARIRWRRSDHPEDPHWARILRLRAAVITASQNVGIIAFGVVRVNRRRNAAAMGRAGLIES